MKKILIICMIALLVVLSGCATSIKDINTNNEKYMGKKVIVSGEVIAPIDFGKMKGFTLRQDDTSIMVSSEKVPSQGDTVTVRGMVVRGMLMGPYIYADKVAVKD